jgi:hypothetical protein
MHVPALRTNYNRGWGSVKGVTEDRCHRFRGSAKNPVVHCLRHGRWRKEEGRRTPSRYGVVSSQLRLSWAGVFRTCHTHVITAYWRHKADTLCHCGNPMYFQVPTGYHSRKSVTLPRDRCVARKFSTQAVSGYITGKLLALTPYLHTFCARFLISVASHFPTMHCIRLLQGQECFLIMHLCRPL